MAVIGQRGGAISAHSRVISHVVARIRSLGGAITCLGAAISCAGEGVSLLDTVISMTVARIRSPGVLINALVSRVSACAAAIVPGFCAPIRKV